MTIESPQILVNANKVILMFSLTLKFDTFVETSFCSGFVKEAAPTDKSKQTTNVTKNYRRFTCFGKRKLFSIL